MKVILYILGLVVFLNSPVFAGELEDACEKYNVESNDKYEVVYGTVLRVGHERLSEVNCSDPDIQCTAEDKKAPFYALMKPLGADDFEGYFVIYTHPEFKLYTIHATMIMGSSYGLCVKKTNNHELIKNEELSKITADRDVYIYDKKIAIEKLDLKKQCSTLNVTTTRKYQYVTGKALKSGIVSSPADCFNPTGTCAAFMSKRAMYLNIELSNNEKIGAVKRDHRGNLASRRDYFETGRSYEFCLERHYEQNKKGKVDEWYGLNFNLINPLD
ncbi:MAG: hypothetical protein ACTHOO_04705 [Alcanivorax sp.]